jgi:hypothetical protein
MSGLRGRGTAILEQGKVGGRFGFFYILYDTHETGILSNQEKPKRLLSLSLSAFYRIFAPGNASPSPSALSHFTV